ncbi:SUMF1/EgtB/PvdO family nonheme iron enzyme [Snuella lapsa]|uniref:SUMF1/EgtB/PvdO family nonheme iron enzyme n=2 Tax=Snuella lapsa TaxID=870481 RepID=A0ABP6YM07_9FLAO
MIHITGGNYTMGGMDNVDDGGDPELRIADECPHSVSVKDFYIGKYEVTQADWFKIMGTRPSKFANCDECPVEQVSWDDIQNFIAAINLKYGETYRLPTEEEWEFASRGGEKSFGYTYAGSNNPNEVAWFEENSDSRPHPVGQLKPNELGLYDMSGNIWEWVSNNKTPYPCDKLGNILDSKVLRGGSFSHRKGSIRTKDRNARASSMRLPTLGFRLAK